jgi:hypothetical protein
MRARKNIKNINEVKETGEAIALFLVDSFHVPTKGMENGKRSREAAHIFIYRRTYCNNRF